MYFDEKLTALREKKGLSRKEAAEKMDITEAILDALETGFKDPDTIEMRKITELYGVTQDELADDEPYVNAFSALFANSDMSECNLGSAFAMTAGLMGKQNLPQAQEEASAQTKITVSKTIPVLKSVKLIENEPVYDYLEQNIVTANMPEGNYLAFTVTDDNMLGIGICKNDLAVIRLQKNIAENEIAALICQGKLTLYKIRAKDGQTILEPANPLIGSATLSDDDYILGKLVEVRKYF